MRSQEIIDVSVASEDVMVKDIPADVAVTATSR